MSFKGLGQAPDKDQTHVRFVPCVPISVGMCLSGKERGC